MHLTYETRAELFGHGESNAVGDLLLRMSHRPSLCRVVGQDVDGDATRNSALSFGICLLVQMVFADCLKFHSRTIGKIPDETKTPISREPKQRLSEVLYVTSSDPINR